MTTTVLSTGSNAAPKLKQHKVHRLFLLGEFGACPQGNFEKILFSYKIRQKVYYAFAS